MKPAMPRLSGRDEATLRRYNDRYPQDWAPLDLHAVVGDLRDLRELLNRGQSYLEAMENITPPPLRELKQWCWAVLTGLDALRNCAESFLIMDDRLRQLDRGRRR